MHSGTGFLVKLLEVRNMTFLIKNIVFNWMSRIQEYAFYMTISFGNNCFVFFP